MNFSLTKDDIEYLVKSQQVEHLIDIIDKDITDPYPICIPSYKNRNKKFFTNVVPQLKCKVFIFVYDYDFTESGYDQYVFPDNVQVVKLHVDFRNIRQKRGWIVDYMLNLGYQKITFVDDDVYSADYAYKAKPTPGFAYRKHTTLEKMVKCSQYILDLYDAGITGASIYCNIQFFKFDKALIYRTAYALFSIDIGKCKKHGINFTSEMVHEDMDVQFRLAMCGYPIYALPWLALNMYAVNKIEKSTFNSKQKWELDRNTYLKFPWCIYFDPRCKDGNIDFKLCVNFKNIIGNKNKVDNKVYEFFKNNSDFYDCWRFLMEYKKKPIPEFAQERTLPF